MPNLIFTPFSVTGGGSVSGAVRAIIYPIGTGAMQDSTNTIPVLAVILQCSVEILVPYTLGTTIKVGNTVTDDLIQTTTDNDAELAGIYEKGQNTTWPILSVVRTTVVGAPAVGSGNTIILYCVPDA
jgi:hypothetical protein